MLILVTGGVRSGKSWHAESMLTTAPSVSYVAPGPTVAEDPDPDWASRIAAHQQRRPATWTTVETRDLASALRLEGPVLVDCLGTWLTATIDAHAMWEAPSVEVTAMVGDLIAGVVEVLAERDDVILVTNEVGWGVVPAHRSGRLFRDLLGLVNQRVATACDEVHLVVAGRVLRL
ncbi:bifunctional adenosylcobinamide kinase/adenosylcobinamide-phosphate guanylyltransferase [Nocardioides sp.]|uniref:bifunctional adenosylcobinamide kinase/adenosylcobinamide-phosphate guanylyltransferase n=1 Tax=Nocardioides sp. TaxID=35761 RepID=UPI002C3EBF53|nr:bifunctional adenosylcobinamide kinase/adenosylcobinamide-phosphate guanylyltransferase [Nocardioides sp.]HXH79445.1 bifunctional adenosylcobinamide kinase/adenosylcobinamide-phosphate guanylyltransferase [Nocardioides sp.]